MKLFKVVIFETDRKLIKWFGSFKEAESFIHEFALAKARCISSVPLPKTKQQILDWLNKNVNEGAPEKWLK
jgi:hypothetical protein